MIKEFVPYDTVRNNALKLAYTIARDGFIPDIIYSSLRGGAYLANIISEYFKVLQKEHKPVLYAAVVARSYTDVRQRGRVMVDGWTYAPEHLRYGDKILLVDDIFDTGKTINFLVEELLRRGIPRGDIKVAVHDYKYFSFLTEQLPVQPDYWSRKFTIASPEEDRWIHYLSHELTGLSAEELEEQYFSHDPELREALNFAFAKA